MNPVNPTCAARSTRETCAGKRLWHWGWILLGALLIAPSTAGAVLDTFLAEARALFPAGLARPALVCPLDAQSAVRRASAPAQARTCSNGVQSQAGVLDETKLSATQPALAYYGRPGSAPDNPRAPPA